MKQYKALFYAGTVLSLLVGLGHFFVPAAFEWYSYIPREYQNLIVGIDWVNLCFSLLLFGLSFMTLAWGKKIFAGNREAIGVFGFLTLVWVFRVAVAIIEPWPLEPVAFMAYAQFFCAVFIMLALLIPFVKIAARARRSK